ncbi:MAG TPA: PadR family transcriptional regulator [Solirubrobacteraceae bacterium]
MLTARIVRRRRAHLPCAAFGVSAVEIVVSARHQDYYVIRYTAMRSSDPSLLIMASLADGPKHGYAMTRDVKEMAGVKLGPGTLYGAIARLEERGLIEPLETEDRRRPYRLTGSGAAVLREQLTALERVARLGLGRLSAAEARA